MVPVGQITGNGAECLDDSAGGTTDGNPVILYTCSGGSNQKWTLNTDSTVRTLGKCLTAGTGTGAATSLSPCTGAANQKWTARPDGTMASTASGLCLDVYGGGTADRTAIDTWYCGTVQANQVWALPI